MVMTHNYRKQIEGFRPCCAQEEGDKAIIMALCKAHEDILTRDNLLCHLTASGLILNGAMDKMLMTFHNIYQTWTWTGGHTDGDGDLEAVALREAIEETGVSRASLLRPEMASLDIIPVYGHVKLGKYVSAHLHLNASYLLVASERDKLSVRQGENSGVAWVPLPQVAARSGEPELIRVYGKMLSRLGIAL